MFNNKESLRNEKVKSPELFNNLIANITGKEGFNFKDSAFIIDIDGVLVDVDLKIFLQGLFYFLVSKEKFKKFLEKNKINFPVLRCIINLTHRGSKIILFTSRLFSKNKNYFPFISEEAINIFNKRNITIIPFPKFLGVKPPEQIFNYIKNNKDVFYIGSGFIDRLMYTKLKKMKDNIYYYQLNLSK